MTTILETPRLLISCLAPEDAPFILELLNQPSFIQNIADKGVRDLDGARAYLQGGPMASYARHGFGLWKVSLKEDGRPIGICGLIKRDGLDDVDVGYALLERFWSRGYAVEAAAACLEHGFAKLGLPRIVAITAPGNEASGKVLERIGMTFQGMIQLPQAGGQNRLYAVDRKG
jgi:RimJ/RimL family protein N-acetyltransferase